MRARLAAGADGDELQAFCDWLLQLGEGRLPGPEEGFVQLPPPLVMDADIDVVIDWVFGDLAERHGDRQWMASRAVLAPRNTRVGRGERRRHRSLPRGGRPPSERRQHGGGRRPAGDTN